uniref:Serine peptidase inhibitor, Kazal type 2, tandem duplicate 1 n=1 Tax=Oncorhynchus kisutch TaxID=8019 RepID=A0A8C7MAR4_ONCKI
MGLPLDKIQLFTKYTRMFTVTSLVDITFRATFISRIMLRNADCSQYNLPMCPRNFEPVCGSDGTNYSNECMLCFQNMERKSNILIRSKGEC